MSQDLKNRYYSLVSDELLESISEIFTELDHLILKHASEEEMMGSIAKLESLEPRLYDEILHDWKEGVLR